MSWLFSRALVAEYSAGTCSDGEPSAPLNLKPTEHKFSHRGRTMDALSLSRFGLTCAVLTESRGEELLMLFLAAFPVRTSVQPDSVEELKGSSRGCGEKWRGSLAKYDPALSLWKTAQCSLLEDSGEFLATWPRWGLMRDGELYLLPTSEHCTSAKGSGLLPTPSGTSNHGKNHVAGRLDEWGGSSNPWRGTEIGKTYSPAFEEWVMGWPVQWTELTAYETDRFHAWQQAHGGF